MPWTPKSFAAKHNKSLSGAGAAKAASMANAILKRSGDDGLAIATAAFIDLTNPVLEVRSHL